jgi:hypothetical protein
VRARGVIPSVARDLQLLLGCAVLAAGCSENTSSTRRFPASIETVTAPASTATVGSSAGTWSVVVKDAGGEPLSGVVVSFGTVLGAGRPGSRFDTTGVDGIASTELLVGTIPGQNQLSATVARVAPAKSVTVAGTAGPVTRVAIVSGSQRFTVTRNSVVVGAIARDGFGNSTGASVTWLSRNPALVTVNPGTNNNATVVVASRPGQTYVVASVGAASDSIPVAVLGAGSSPCAFVASPTVLAVGETVSFDGAEYACVRSEAPGAEFALVTHYSTASSTSVMNAELVGFGIVSPSTPWPSVAETNGSIAVASEPDISFEAGLRERERREIPGRVDGARAWYSGRPAVSLRANLREGEHVDVNVNASDFCIRPDVRSMRVAAITNTAVILADNGNPPGGFTDQEYRAFGVAMDTLVYPLVTAAFGAPTDIDGNGRAVIAFTRAVNELTPRSSSTGIALGFFFSRDLFPRESSAGSCPGTNAAEMFYVLVPDPTGVSSDPRSKTFVQNVVIGTVGHELQHLINSSRRLYLNPSAAASEELWLNEGLSHIAEELIFYLATGLAPRQNIGGAQLQPGTSARALFDTFLRGNFGRYQSYLRSPELNSPISADDFLATRGATWAFLRYVADRAGATDGTLWHRLVNAQGTGLVNLDAALAGTGLTALGLLREWSTSVFTDDAITGGTPPFQPSWNFVTGMPAVGLAFGLAPIALANETAHVVAIRSGGSNYVRFAVPQNAEALLQVRGITGGALPPGVRLTVVRTR